MTLKVAWPYVTVKLRSETGLVIREFYAGAPVPANADPDDCDRLVRKGALIDEDAPYADVLAVPAGTPIPGEPPNVPVTETPAVAGNLDERLRLQAEAAAAQADPGGRPKDYASKGEWVEYAVSKRADDVSEDDARSSAEGKTKDALIAEHG